MWRDIQPLAAPYYCFMATETVPIFTKEFTDPIDERARRAMCTIRLLFGGQVRLHEKMIVPHLGQFTGMGLGGHASLETTNAPGQQSHVNGSRVDEIQLVYEGLAEFSREFPVAFSRFQATGYRATSDDQVIDASIVMENLLLPEENQELAYRFAVRLACLLGTNSSERRSWFETARELYKLRSALVHGDAKQIDKIKARSQDDWGQKSVSIAASTILTVLKIRREHPDSPWKNVMSDLLPFV